MFLTTQAQEGVNCFIHPCRPSVHIERGTQYLLSGDGLSFLTSSSEEEPRKSPDTPLTWLFTLNAKQQLQQQITPNPIRTKSQITKQSKPKLSFNFCVSVSITKVPPPADQVNKESGLLGLSGNVYFLPPYFSFFVLLFVHLSS